MRVGNIQDYNPFLHLPETWYLVDGSSPLIDGYARTVIAVSPKSSHSDDNRYQAVFKRGPQIYYMPPWEFDELSKCRESVNIYRVVPMKLMEELYIKIGGVPRYVLQFPMLALYRGDTVSDAEEFAYYRIKCAIDQVKDVSKLLQSFSQARESLNYSSRLLHYWPINGGKNYTLKWASSHIEEKLVEHLTDQAWGNLLNQLAIKDGSINRGCMFELYVHHIFRKGSCEFEIKELGGSELGRLSVPKDPTIKFIKTPTELSGETDGVLFIPSIPNFACIDFFLAPDKMFQVTVSPNHPIKMEPFKTIVEKIAQKKKVPRLYFVVPGDIYCDFTPQNFLTTAGTVAKSPAASIRGIKQYALKIDLEGGLKKGGL